jgi:hypothetical protein
LPAGEGPLRAHFIVLRYSSIALMFLAVIATLMSHSQDDVVVPGALLLAGATAGAISLRLAWAVGFRFLFGAVAVLSAFWAEINDNAPFYVGWGILILGMGALLVGGLSLETSYLATMKARPGKTSVGAVALGRMALMLGIYLLMVMMVGLAAVIVSFVFIMESFPLWAVGVTTVGLVLMVAYLVSKGAVVTDQSG